MNCKLVPTGANFNNKKVYKCEYCGVTLALDSPDIEMLCFKQMIDAKNLIREQHNLSPIGLESTSPSGLSDFVKDKIYQAGMNPETEPDMCSNKQIEERLKICENCEHYEKDVCELCGCKIVRAQNYMNKLAHKSASCPIGKWLPISD